MVVLTRRGKPVAEIRPLEGESVAADTLLAIAALRKFRRTLKPGSFDIADLVGEGRR